MARKHCHFVTDYQLSCGLWKAVDFIVSSVETKQCCRLPLGRKLAVTQGYLGSMQGSGLDFPQSSIKLMSL